MSYNPASLDALLQARALSYEGLSKRLGIGHKKLEEELRRAPHPKQSLLNNIAKELVLPDFVFFMENIPKLNEIIPDFRSSNPISSPKSKGTIRSIEFALEIQRTAIDHGAQSAPSLPKLSLKSGNRIGEVAFEAREFFGITLHEQTQAKDAKAFYTICRKKIEDKGIFVLHDSFSEKDGSGFCLADDQYPIIVINTKQQTRGRRLFTLVHELAHILMGKSGISDPFQCNNDIERLCNQFASSFLVPDEFVPKLLKNISPSVDPSVELIAKISRQFKISQEATVVKLENLGLINPGSHARWLKSIHNIGNPDYSESGGGAGGPPPQEKVKLAKYGFRFASVFSQLLQNNSITEIGLFRATGLKPTYQRPYFDFVESLDEQELHSLELVDE
jgi:Zn-dependent peptidase ImmA (M78 family)